MEYDYMFANDFEKTVKSRAQRLYLAQLLKTEPTREGITKRNPYTFHKAAISAFILGACWVKEQVEHHAQDLHEVSELGKARAAELYSKRFRSQNYSLACRTAFLIGVAYTVEQALAR